MFVKQPPLHRVRQLNLAHHKRKQLPIMSLAMHASQITLHTTHYTQHTTKYTLQNTHYKLHTTHCTLHTHTTHYTLHTTHYTQHTTKKALEFAELPRNSDSRNNFLNNVIQSRHFTQVKRWWCTTVPSAAGQLQCDVSKCGNISCPIDLIWKHICTISILLKYWYFLSLEETVVCSVNLIDISGVEHNVVCQEMRVFLVE